MPETFPEHKGLHQAFGVIIQIVPKVLGFLWEVSPLMLSVTCVLLVIQAVLPAAIVWMTKVIIDAVVEAAGGEVVWTILLKPVGIMLVCLHAQVF